MWSGFAYFDHFAEIILESLFALVCDVNTESVGFSDVVIL